jgi:hypothetical protein
MSKEPLALRQADALEDEPSIIDLMNAASTIRHLHEVDTELLEALRELQTVVNLAIADGDWIVDGACDPDACMTRAEDLIAKATGEQK